MTVPGFEANQIDTLLSSLSFADADALTRPCPTARNFVDSMLHTVCLAPLDEADERRGQVALRRYAQLVEHDTEGIRKHTPVAVAAVLDSAVANWVQRDAPERVRTVLTTLGGPASTERECALRLYVRVVVGRLRDGYVHPFLAATHLAWPDLADWDDPAVPEIAAMRVAAHVVHFWPQPQAERSVLEQELLDAVEPISWPPQFTTALPVPPIEWPEADYTTFLGRAVYAVAAAESYVLFELPNLPGTPIDVTTLRGLPLAELSANITRPELLDSLPDQPVRAWLSAAGAALKHIAVGYEELLHARPAVSGGTRMLHSYTFAPSGKAYLYPVPEARIERLINTAEAHRAHLIRLRARIHSAGVEERSR